jgi:hypothetical protein
MECALWTYNTVTATNGSGKASSSSRAAIAVWVEIDGVPAAPEEVVYCDRAQALGWPSMSRVRCRTPHARFLAT